MLEEHKPDVAILTETKTGSHHRRAVAGIKQALKPYRTYMSNRPHNPDITLRTAGVMICVAERFSQQHSITADPVPGQLNGYVGRLCISPDASTPLHIIGVYCPEDPHVRKRIHEYCTQAVRAAAEKGDNLILGGDWNAVLDATDRSTNVCDAADRMHQRFAEAANLKPVHSPEREPTYSQLKEGILVHQSRIDDVLIAAHTLEGIAKEGTPYERVYECGGNFDHRALCTYLPLAGLRIYPQQVKPPTAEHHAHSWSRIKLPITTECKTNARMEMESTLTAEISALHRTLRSAMAAVESASTQLEMAETEEEASNLMRDLRQHPDVQCIDVSATSRTLGALLLKCLEILEGHCERKPPNTGKLHPPRAISKKLMRLYNEHKNLKTQLTARKASSKKIETKEHRGLAETLVNGIPGGPAPIESTEEGDKLNATGAATAGHLDNELYDTIRAKGEEIRRLVREVRLNRSTKAAKRFQKLLSKKPKQAHRQIREEEEQPRGIAAIRHPEDGKVRTDPEGILDALHTHFSKLAKPISGTRTGKFLPGDAPRDYPWTQAGAPDPMRKLARPNSTPASLLPGITDPMNYRECLNHLARNKAPGPDGIPNELLQALPDTLQQAIHQLMILMWTKAEIPRHWTASETVLLPKKGDPLLIKNKRPIALSNTIYKLYTSLVTLNIVLFSEQTHIFTEAQEGYLRQRNTERQIQNILHAIEDAALTSRDLILLYVDFTSAFNTIDQDKLLVILYDLGYPVDLI